jgi:hypothetical protein
MKASEILHGLAELLAGIEGGQGLEAGSTMAPQAQQQAATLVPAEVDHSAHAEAGTFVPPLQAKIELLKKAVNVDSIYDTAGPDEDLTGQGADNEDDLARMKKMAGINPVVADEAGSDEPLDV